MSEAVIEAVAAAADHTAAMLEGFAYSRRCEPGDQRGFLHAANGWRTFAEELRRPTPRAEADR